jgi:hypothetical protein
MPLLKRGKRETIMRFIVVSYDDDQQQTFFDVTEADTAEKAKELAGELRDYAIPCHVLDRAEFLHFVDYMYTAKPEDVLTEATLESLKERYL